MKIPHVHKKTAKGRAYWYFDTGTRNTKGRPILARLPDPESPDFGRKLADAQRGRTMRAKRGPGVVTVHGLADLFEKSPHFKSGLAASSQRNYRIYLDVIRDQIGPMPVNAVERQHAQLLLDELAERPSAANMTVRTLGALFAWGVKRGHALANPVKEIEYHPEGEHEPWPQWLLDAALVAEDRTVRLATRMLLYTGQRISDVLSMQWTCIRDGRIEVRQQKTDKPLSIRIHASLDEVLAETPRRGFYILSKEDGTGYASTTIRRLLQGFAADLGVKVVPHGLRKNAVNGLLEAGCSAAEVAAITGQSLQMVEHYARRRDQTKLGDSAVLKWQRIKS